jgi:hypothetical protein
MDIGEENSKYKKALKKFVRNFSKNESLSGKFHKETADLKKGAVCHYLETHIRELTKTVIFAYHMSMLDAIEALLLEQKVHFVRIDGNTSDHDFKKRMQDFKATDNCKVILMALKTVESGMDLTEATSIIFTELDWSPVPLVQAESLVHKFGNPRPIKIRYLLANKTTDKFVWESIKKKEATLTDLGVYEQHLTDGNLFDDESEESSDEAEGEVGKIIKCEAITEDSESQSLFNSIKMDHRNKAQVLDDSDSDEEVKDFVFDQHHEVMLRNIKEAPPSDDEEFDIENNAETELVAVKEEDPIDIIEQTT